MSRRKIDSSAKIAGVEAGLTDHVWSMEELIALFAATGS